jgi:hypothetical protein
LLLQSRSGQSKALQLQLLLHLLSAAKHVLQIAAAAAAAAPTSLTGPALLLSASMLGPLAGTPVMQQAP